MRASLAIAALLLAGCVNDVSNGIAPGSLGGPCLSNGTCNTGLDCVLQNGKGICEQPDATIDATLDQSADAPAETSSDAGADAPCVVTAQEACPGKGSCLSGCCATTGFCALSGSCTDNSTPWACVNNAKCGDAGLCCVGVTIEDAGACPPVAASTPAACHAGPSCSPGQKPLCTSNTDCPKSTPTCVTILVAGMSTPIGVCQ